MLKHSAAERAQGRERCSPAHPTFGLFWYFAMARLSLLTSATAAITSGSSKPCGERVNGSTGERANGGEEDSTGAERRGMK